MTHFTFPARISSWAMRQGLLYDRRRATLELAGPAGGHEDIAIVAVEAFDQLHTVLP